MEPKRLSVTLAGATGWAGSALAEAIGDASDLALVAAVSRSAAGKSLPDVLGAEYPACPVFGSVEEALSIPSDVFFEYTKPDSAKRNVLTALAAKRHVVVGTSGLTDEDYAEIDQEARRNDRGVLAVGNFALTVILLQKFAEIAARYISQWELIDYARDDKIDAPSGTARELARRLASVGPAILSVPLDRVEGEVGARGATLNGTQVHSVRLPGHVLGIEAIFGLPDQKLILRHEAGASAAPYVGGALLAIRRVSSLTGLHRGLDSVMEWGNSRSTTP